MDSSFYDNKINKFNEIYTIEEFDYLKEVKFINLFKENDVNFSSYIPKIQEETITDFNGNVYLINQKLEIYDFILYLENDFQNDFNKYVNRMNEQKKLKIIENEKNLEKQNQNKMRTKKLMKFLVPTLCVIVVIYFACINFFIPNNKYQKAGSLVQQGRYEDALDIYKSINNYKDSSEQIIYLEKIIKNNEQYQKAMKYYNEENYKDALPIFESLENYNDSEDYFKKCIEQIKILGDKFFNEGNYVSAKELYEIIKEYYDVENNLIICETENEKSNIYNEALKLFDSLKFSEAVEKFNEIKEYGNASEYISKCNELINNYEKWVGSYALNRNDEEARYEIVLIKKEDDYTLQLLGGTSSSTGERMTYDLVNHFDNRIEFHSEKYDVFATISFEYVSNQELIEYYDKPNFETHLKSTYYRID